MILSLIILKPPYEITSRILSLYGEITERLGQCKGLMLVRPEARLRRENRIRTIHSSLAIEGNTLELDQVTAILENKRVIAPAKDILEVQNAIRAYDLLPDVQFNSVDDFLKVHGILLQGLIDETGIFRTQSVGIMKGSQLQHVAPPAQMINGLMKDLFDYVDNDSDPIIIKSCVFHYEMEFIHPFQDGNGRMGRYWQTRILMEESSLFESLPIEATIKSSQREYYQALSDSDAKGASTLFIEFMLQRILEALDEVLNKVRNHSLDYHTRVGFALPQLEGWFDRKKYLETCKGISSATASRDLRQMTTDGLVEVSGVGRMTKYRRKI